LTSISGMGSNPGRSCKLIFLPSLWIMLKRFGTARAPTRSGSCEAASLGSFSDRRDQKLREMKWAIFLFHSYGYRLERRSMIRGCAGGHRKSRRTAAAIHRRNICGRLQTITFVWGRFQATNIGEVVLIGTHGAQLIVASGAIRRQGFPNFVLHGEAPPASDSRNTFVNHQASAWAPTERPLCAGSGHSLTHMAFSIRRGSRRVE
jgi:hypothetical protein